MAALLDYTDGRDIRNWNKGRLIQNYCKQNIDPVEMAIENAFDVNKLEL